MHPIFEILQSICVLYNTSCPVKTIVKQIHKNKTLWIEKFFFLKSVSVFVAMDVASHLKLIPRVGSDNWDSSLTKQKSDVWDEQTVSSCRLQNWMKWRHGGDRLTKIDNVCWCSPGKSIVYSVRLVKTELYNRAYLRLFMTTRTYDSSLCEWL